MERLRNDLLAISTVFNNSISNVDKLFDEQASWREEKKKQLIELILRQKEGQEAGNDHTDTQNAVEIEGGGRPKRTAQIKAQVKMIKQKNKLKGKLRRPTEDDIKKEEAEFNQLLKKSVVHNNIKTESRNTDIDIVNDENNEASDNSMASSECAVVLETQENPIHISDDDTEKMPPPSKPLKGKKPPSTVNKKYSSLETKSVRSTIPSETISESDESAAVEKDQTEKRKGSRKNVVNEVHKIKKEKESLSNHIQSSFDFDCVGIHSKQMTSDISTEGTEEHSTRRITRSSKISTVESTSSSNKIVSDSSTNVTEEHSSKRRTRNSKTSSSESTSSSNKTNMKMASEIKKEKLSLIVDIENEIDASKSLRTEENTKDTSDAGKEKNNETFESIYEDAIATKSTDESSVESVSATTTEISENNQLKSDTKLYMRLTVNLGPKMNDLTELLENQPEIITVLPIDIKEELVESVPADSESASCDQTFDIISVPELNETVTVAKKTTAALNETVVLENNPAARILNETIDIPAKIILNQTIDIPTKVVNNENEGPSGSSLITDDELEHEDVEESPVEKPQVTHTTRSRNQALFSSSSPVKSRVKAFENVLNAPKMETPPVRITRTKTRAMQKKNGSTESIKENNDAATNKNVGSHSALKLPRTKLYATPQSALKTLKKTASYKALGSAGNLSNIITDITTFGTKPGSAIKNAVNRDETHRKQTQKEDDALRKKDALIQAKIGEKIAKREEKARMVLEARQAKERERELFQQQAREKEEKHKQMLLEREEKIKEENRLKKQLSAQKALESEKRRKLEEQARVLRLKEIEEEQKKLEAQKKREQEEAERLKQRRLAEEMSEYERIKKAKMEQQNRLQVQLMQKKMQMMSTTIDSPFKVPPVAMVNGFENLDSGDSTDEEDKPAKVPRPAWSERNNRLGHLQFQIYVSSKLHDRYFSMQPTTPNLAQIFPGIDPRKLRRKSSAVWKTPPRYSQIPKH